MADPSPRPSDHTSGVPASRGLWVLVVVLLAPAVVVPLLVGLYDRTDPTLWGFPFYYWFQFALILASAVLTITAYFVAKEATRRDRAARRDGGAR